MSSAPEIKAYDPRTNPYRAKRAWPPDFEQLSPKHQFRLERRYRRRTQLKWARPGWKKSTKIVQWGLIGGLTVYGVLFMDWGNPDAFKQIRDYYRDTMISMNIHRHPTPPSSQEPQSEG